MDSLHRFANLISDLQLFPVFDAVGNAG